ncbi:MAG: biotin--[acetyl-CoA-carboxylase] ligase [Candidatus Omnitrophica bacterium]|nr:biotin--[acetyl-CoA-carboxylase] ligase [Candidatus Omnitrophota bacterium]
MKYQIYRYKQLVSTNDLVLDMARKGVREGIVVWTDYQTHGRGRFQRRWVSPRGKDILFSVLLRPPLAPHKAALLTRVAAHAVSDILKKRWHISNHIKLPNDVRVGKKKICGILLETSFKRGELDYAILGVGLNVNSCKKELVRGATSISEECGKTVSRKWLFKVLLKELAVRYKKAVKDFAS